MLIANCSFILTGFPKLADATGKEPFLKILVCMKQVPQKDAPLKLNETAAWIDVYKRQPSSNLDDGTAQQFRCVRYKIPLRLIRTQNNRRLPVKKWAKTAGLKRACGLNVRPLLFQIL